MLHRYLKYIYLLQYLMIFGCVTADLYASCSPSATPGNDTVVCVGATSGYQEFYGGDDHIVLQSGVTGNGIYWLDEKLAGNSVTDGNDTFVVSDSHFLWVFGFNGGDYFEVNGSTFSNLYADTNPNWVDQRGDDTIIINRSVSNGWILGGNDADTLIIKDSNVSFVAAGYSDIYSDLPGYIDYTPFDGDDNITLDNVDFNVTNYAYPNRPGTVEGGKSDDTILFINGGNAYSVTGGHGDDTIIVEDDTQFNRCTFVNDRNSNVTCGIYGDEPYESEPGSPPIAAHGDDSIILKNGHLLNNVVNGGDGSDQLTIYAPVRFFDSVLDGGDDRNISDGFVDVLLFEGWVGDVNGSNLRNWEQIVIDDFSDINLRNNELNTSMDGGTNLNNGMRYGLTIQQNSRVSIFHDFTINGNLQNDAEVTLSDSNLPGTVLNITGDYGSNGGVLYIDTVLNSGYPAISDVLHVSGNTSGISQIYITNIGGLGAQTTGNGILVVQVDGNSNGEFFLQNSSLSAGDYLYTLYKAVDGNWYLHSTYSEKTGKITGNVSETILCKANRPMKNVTIILLDMYRQVVARTKTDANGNYRFDNVIPGEYILQEAQPCGYSDVSENEGGADNDSVNTLVNTIGVIVDNGEIDKNNDFVERCNHCVYAPVLPSCRISTACVSKVTANSAQLKWTDSCNEIGYEIYVNGLFIARVGENVTHYTVDELQPDTQYSYAIVAISSTGGRMAQTIVLKTKNVDWLIPIISGLLNP